MDEYFCPNCGAILNDQYGFAPDGGTWRCTECGELLVDDDVYNGDSFEGIAWYCDSCGALLNRQCGFSDSYGSWTCTECGHHNRISEDDIVSEEQIEFSCPNCGVALDFQPGFNKYDDDWECSSCGAHLHHSYSDDEYTIIKHICPRCGNVQSAEPTCIMITMMSMRREKKSLQIIVVIYSNIPILRTSIIHIQIRRVIQQERETTKVIIGVLMSILIIRLSKKQKRKQIGSFVF